MKNKNIAVIGMGYVGLPLAVEFGKIRKVFGFDINEVRVNQLHNGIDLTNEINSQELKEAIHLSYTTSLDDIKNCSIYILSVPTPIDQYKKPDLSYLEKSSKMIGSVLKKGDLVIYESTVYPGATEEICVPLLEKYSGLKFNRDFSCGYSPERINPGDKEHRLVDIKKITAGSSPLAAIEVDELYKEIISAGTFKASSIRVAEAAKVIENTQRDVNIALINEFAIIFQRLGLDTKSILDAAATKWNFLPFKPGLVGGHCIGVDPYYLTHKALEVGYNPEMILAGRKLNDNMGAYIADELLKLMNQKKILVSNSKILIMGFAFKEDCPDIRNTRVIDVLEALHKSNCNVEVYDPYVNFDEVYSEYKIELLDSPVPGYYDAIILAVAHNQFKKMSIDKIKSFGKAKHVIYDVKSIMESSDVDGRL